MDFERIVMWDPVLHGAEYLDLLHRIETAWIERNYYLSGAERRQAEHEYAGYRLSHRMVEDFRSLDAGAYLAVPNSKLRVVTTVGGVSIPIQGVSHEATEFSCRWDTGSEDILVPGLVMDRLVTWLTTP